MRNTILLTLTMILLLLAAGSANAEKIWMIGQADGRYRELAAAGAYQEYTKAFPEDVHFTVGVSKAAADWPYIHPGPDDAWAESKTHSFDIEFSMKKAPKSACRVLLYLVDTQSGGGPNVLVKVNDNACAPLQLPTGAGDASLTNAAAGRRLTQSVVFPGSWLKRGKNILQISIIDGSWMLYDAVALESGVPNAPQIGRVSAVCTPMFRTVDGVMKQAVRVEIENNGLEGKGKLSLAESAGSSQEVDIQQGTQSYFLLVDPFTKTEKRRVVLLAGEKTQEAVFDARPEKQWKLFVAASAHTDIGYTDLQEKCMELHVDNAATALNATAENPDFKWNLEVFAHADWIKELKPELVPALERGIRDKKIGLTGLYLNMLTGLCSGEEMMWLLRPAQRYSRGLGVPVDMASLNDVPSAAGTLPMFLRQAGIRYFSDAINEDRGPVFLHAAPEMNQSPFWWEALDGSRVLAIFTRTYFQVTQINMHASVSAMENKLPEFMSRFTRADYPGDAIYINGAFLDNCAMSPHYAEVATEWNAKWDFPKVILSTTSEYFRYVEATFGNALPVYRGDMGGFWEDGAASTAKETSMVRWAKANLSTAEKWQALYEFGTTASDFALQAAEATWKDILYYDEHTWGSAVSISDPNNPQSTGQWARKAAFAENALKKSQAAEQVMGLEALRGLARAPQSERGHLLVVSNPLSWARDIEVVLPEETRNKSIRDKVSGKRVPAQYTADGRLVFIAADVPAMGYRIFVIENTPAPVKDAVLEQDGDAFSWKTNAFRFHIDPKTGGLDKLTEVATGKEWVDGSQGRTLNQYLYVKGGEGTAMIHPGSKPAEGMLIEFTHETAEVKLVENGPARAVLQIARSGQNVSPVDTDLIFRADGAFDAVNVIHKQETLEKEAGYFVFPFGLNAPDEARAFVDLPYGIVEADQEQMPGACREWYTANTFAAVANTTGSAYVAAPDTPLFTIGDINRGRWPNRLEGNRHVLYAYVFNNYWHTNYKASQGGDLRCAFSIKLSNAPFDPVEATRFGWERVLDMTPERKCFARAESCRGAAQRSFLTLDEGPVLLGDLLPANGGMMARLYNPTKRTAVTRVNVHGTKVKEMLTTDLFGENGAPLPKDGKVSVPARSMVTVVLKQQ